MAKKSHILVVGGGSIGERHVRCFLNTGRAEVALCEIQAAVRERLAATYPLSGNFATLEYSSTQAFDGAIVCVPAHHHLAIARTLLARGIGLLIEKPLSTCEAGVPELLAAARAAQLPVAVAYVYRSHPALAAMRAALHAGRFGRPLQLVATSGQHFPHYRPAYREIYYADRATGGGAIQDALTHLLNAGEWLVGPITTLTADAEHCVLPGVTVEDTAHLICRHGTVLGSYTLNQHQPANETLLTVVCERGMVRFEMANQRWLSCEQPEQPWKVEDSVDLQRDDLFVRQADCFLDQLTLGTPANCSLEEAWQTLRVNLAALQSAAERRWISL